MDYLLCYEVGNGWAIGFLINYPIRCQLIHPSILPSAANLAEQKTEKLAAKLRELNIDPDPL